MLKSSQERRQTIRATPSASNIVAALLVLSGCSTLIYQVTWVRLLSLSMGSTNASVSTVLTAFFFGMAVGSALAERILQRQRHHLTAYIVLEAIIGLYGVLLLPLLLRLDSIMALLPALGTALVAKFCITVCLLAVPTICMGATFPVLASFLIRHQREIGLRIGQLYSLNTAGAVVGAACSGFLLIPQWGLDGAIYLACALNLLIVLSGLTLNKRFFLSPIGLQQELALSDAPEQRTTPVLSHYRVVLVLFVTGVVGIATEVGWTKYLAIFTGTTIYGFSAILTVFLLGIAVGSWVIRRHLERIQAPAVWLTFGLVLLGAALLLARMGLAFVPKVAEYVHALMRLTYAVLHNPEVSAYVQYAGMFGVVLGLLFLPTFLFGAVFPIALMLYCGNIADLRQRIGRGYAVNTLGSILGAIGAGFWLIPSYGTDVLLMSMALVMLLLPLLFLTALPHRSQQVAVIVIVGVLLAGSWWLPQVDYHTLIASITSRVKQDTQEGKKPTFLFLKEGKASVISVVTSDGKVARLQSNGLPEASIPLNDEVVPPLVESLLGFIPYFLHPAPRTSFVVGFGGGITVQALAYTPIEAIRVVELEPAIVEAVQATAGGGHVLRDPRVHLSFNDARNTLLVEPNTYDLILSQPSHPWLAGAGNLFTQRFFAIVSARLNENGIFAQWVNLFNMDATTLRSIFRAFYGVFPHGFTFVSSSSGDLMLFGSKQPLMFDDEVVTRRMQEPKIRRRLTDWGIDSPQALLWYFALSRDEALAAAGNIPPNTDTRILSEVRLARLVINPKGEKNPYALLEKHFHLDLSPYLTPGEAAITLYNAGRYSLQRNLLSRASKAVEQLKKLNPELAQLLARDPRFQQ